MRRTVVMALLSAMVLVPLLWTQEAWARAGGGGSGGSRGSRSYSPPARPSSPTQIQPSAPASPPTQLPPQRPGWGGMLGGLLVGGLLGSLLFGGLGHGSFGLIELLIIGALVYFGFRALQGRQPQPAAPGGYPSEASPGDGERSAYSAPATMETPAGPSDLDRGVGHIRQLDPGFDPARFTETAADMFFAVQSAWTARDMARAGDVLTDEMRALLQKDCDQMRAEHRINHLENVSVRLAEVTEAWQERGQDYATVHFVASLLDYTTDEAGAQLLDGNRMQPVKFEEYWTFVRPAGSNSWRLSAIQQPA